MFTIPKELEGKVKYCKGGICALPDVVLNENEQKLLEEFNKNFELYR